MATERQKVLGLNSVEHIKTYVYSECKDLKDDVVDLMKQHTEDKINELSVLKDDNGEISDYTIKSYNNDTEDINDIHWELNSDGNCCLSNGNITINSDGSGYIGIKNESDENNDKLAYSDAIYWDANGVIRFGDNISPWISQIISLRNELKSEISRLEGIINQYHAGGGDTPDTPGYNGYIILNNNATKLNIDKIK